MARSAVITGATGMIGRALARQLSRDGWRVRALVNPSTTRLDGVSGLPGVSVVPVPMSGYDEVEPGLIGESDVFFHLAWAGTTPLGRLDARLQADNVRFAIDAVGLAGRLGCAAFVGAGSQAEYGRASGAIGPSTSCAPENAYGAAKLCAGSLSRIACAEAGIRHVWARVFSVYGPHDGPDTLVSYVIRSLLAGERPLLTGCGQVWDYLYCDDAARALQLLAEGGRDGAVYCVGSGASAPLREFVEEIRRQVDPSAPVGFGERPYTRGQVMSLQADTGTLARDVGFEPLTSFEEGVGETVGWWKGRMQ